MTSEKTDPSARLRLARQAAAGANYEEALSDYRWWFDHALEYDKVFYGVRLSYVLHEWRDVGGEYPFALDELRGVRDDVECKLRSAHATWDNFIELAFLNRYSDCESAAHSAFYRTNRDLAVGCVRRYPSASIKDARNLRNTGRASAEVSARADRSADKAERAAGHLFVAVDRAFHRASRARLCFWLDSTTRAGRFTFSPSCSCRFTERWSWPDVDRATSSCCWSGSSPPQCLCCTPSVARAARRAGLFSSGRCSPSAHRRILHCARGQGALVVRLCEGNRQAAAETHRVGD